MITNLDNVFKTSNEIEENGKWFFITDEVQFKMKRFGGANAVEISKLNAKYIGKYQKLITKGIMDKDAERKLYIKVFVEGCMVDWKGLKDDKEKEIPFSVDAAIDLFKKMPDLLEFVMEITSDKEEFLEREEVGNF